MNWFEMLKENRAISQNITHTKVNEEDPKQEDGRCKKKLKEILIRFLIEHAKSGLGMDWETEGLTMELTDEPEVGYTGPLQKSNGLDIDDADNIDLSPLREEDCCLILEEMAKLGNVKLVNAPNNGHTATSHKSWNTTGGTDRLNGIYCSAMAYYTDGEGTELSLEDLKDEHKNEDNIGGKLHVSKYMSWNRDPSQRFGKDVGFFLVVVQTVENEHYDCGTCEEYREEIMNGVEAKFSEMTR